MTAGVAGAADSNSKSAPRLAKQGMKTDSVSTYPMKGEQGCRCLLRFSVSLSILIEELLAPPCNQAPRAFK